MCNFFNVLHQQPFANTQSLKPLILTPGDPAGIGPEISLRAWLAGSHNIVLQGDISYFREIADKAKLAINFAEYDAQSFAGASVWAFKSSLLLLLQAETIAASPAIKIKRRIRNGWRI